MARSNIPGVTRKDLQMITDPNLIQVEDGFNHRQEFDPTKMRSLADSIKEHGIQVPIAVRKDNANKKQPFIIIDGERRLRAVQMLKKEGVKDLPVIPAVIQQCDEDQAFIFSSIANLERDDINPAEESVIVQRLDRMGKSAKEIAQICSRTTQWVSTRLSVAGSSTSVKKAIEDGDLPVDVALEVTRNVPLKDQEKVVKTALHNSASKAELRKNIAKVTKGVVKPKTKDIEYVAKRLQTIELSVKANSKPVYEAYKATLDYALGTIDTEQLLQQVHETLKLKTTYQKAG